MLDSDLDDADNICDAGYYCPAGVGTVTPSAIVQIACPNGKYCPGVDPNLAMVGITCASGTYMLASTSPKSACSPCDAGYYCPYITDVVTTPND